MNGIIASKLLFLGAFTVALAVSACTTPQNGSIVKVESGDQTLVDVKKDAQDNIDIKVGVPKLDRNEAPPPDTTYDY